MDFSKFERDQDSFLLYLIEDYGKNYCTSTFYKHFSDENKLEYLYFRVEIDELIKKLNEEFSDFLTE